MCHFLPICPRILVLYENRAIATQSLPLFSASSLHLQATGDKREGLWEPDKRELTECMMCMVLLTSTPELKHTNDKLGHSVMQNTHLVWTLPVEEDGLHALTGVLAKEFSEDYLSPNR